MPYLSFSALFGSIIQVLKLIAAEINHLSFKLSHHCSPSHRLLSKKSMTKFIYIATTEPTVVNQFVSLESLMKYAVERLGK